MMIVSSIVSFWFFIGCLNLIQNTWKDIKTQYIDDSKNYIMKGLTFSFIPIFHTRFIYLIASIIAISLIIKYLLRRLELAEGDISALTWIFFGLCIINYEYLAIFIVIWLCLHILYFMIRHFWFKMPEKQHFFYYPILTGAFIITYFIWIYR